MTTPSSVLRCVVADDVRASRELMRQCLSNLGLQVDAFCDGQAAWEAVQQSAPALIVTDIEMPRMTGLELLSQVRGSEDKLLREVPVILMTSLLDSEISKIARQHRATTVLIKPLSKEAISGVVDNVMKGETIEAIYDPNSSLTSAIGSQSISPTLRRLVRDADR